MAQDPRSARFQRIVRESGEVAALAARVLELERGHDDAVHAFHTARTAMEDATAELDEVCSQHIRAEERLSVLRQSFNSDTMQHLPADILRYIFAATTALPEDYRRTVQSGNCYSAEHAKAPFTLAGVCSRWRDVALQQSALWTYISTPRYPDDMPPHADRVRLLLLRSKSASLDVLFDWTQRYWQPFKCERALLAEVARHSQRWRTFEFWSHEQMSLPSELDVFKGPLPRLERLCLVTDHRRNYEESTTAGVFLPFAPRLQELVVWGTTLAPYAAHGTFPVLASVRLWQSPDLPQSWPVLAAAARTLTSLHLSIETPDWVNPGPHTALALPNVETMSIDYQCEQLLPYLRALQLPRVRHLRLHPAAEANSYGPWLESIAPTVTTLSLFGHIRSATAHASGLKSLCNVQQLVFGDYAPEELAPEQRSVCDVDTAIFEDRLLWVEEPAWPKLKSVVLKRRALLTVPASVLDFVRWRTVDINDDVNGPRRLEEFRIETEDVPEWLLAEVKRLVGNFSSGLDGRCT